MTPETAKSSTLKYLRNCNGKNQFLADGTSTTCLWYGNPLEHSGNNEFNKGNQFIRDAKWEHIRMKLSA